MKLICLIVIFLTGTLLGKVNGQENKSLVIEGSVATSTGDADGVTIEVFLDGRQIERYNPDNQGRYRIELGLNRIYTLEFTGADYFQQKVVVDTNVPSSVNRTYSPSFDLNMNLLARNGSIDDSITGNPVKTVHFNEETGSFVADIHYTEGQLKQLANSSVGQASGNDPDETDRNQSPEVDELKKAYNRHIQQAETEYNRQEFLAALDGYQAASRIFPEEQYPKDRISEINDLLELLMVAEEKEQALTERLNDLLQQADSHFENGNHDQARDAYQRALSIDPDNVHAATRLSETEKLLATNVMDQEYEQLIAAADNAFDELLYQNALELYRKASLLKEDESYPRQRIEETEKILKELAVTAENLQSYRDAIAQAEKRSEEQQYEQAAEMYKQALSYKPGDEVAMTGLERIGKLKSILDQKKSYADKIEEADRAFEKERYEEALTAYEEASSILPGEDLPGQRIQQIREIVAENERLADQVEQARIQNEENERQYTRTMVTADSLFNASDYDAALEAYKQAELLKPDEELPGRQVRVTAEIINRRNADRQNYDRAVAAGNRAYEQEQFDEARAAYKQAQQALPEESYPRQMLEQIAADEEAMERLAAEKQRVAELEAENKRRRAEEEAAEQARLEAENKRRLAEEEAAEQARLAAVEAETAERYNRIMAAGDSLSELNAFEEALDAYRSAQQIKPEEALPGQRIAEINSTLEALEHEQELYDDAIKRGDEAFRDELPDDARAAYNEALQLKPEEDYPARMLDQIDAAEATRTQLKTDALTETEAQELKPDDEPADAAGEATTVTEQTTAEEEDAEKKRLALLAAEQELQYNYAVSRGDSHFNLKEYEQSLIFYNQALEVKKDAFYPLQRIAEINKLQTGLSEQQQLDEEYNKVLLVADDLFGKGEWVGAITEYQNALGIKPDEEYPRIRIQKAEALIREQEAKILAEKQAASEIKERQAAIEKQQTAQTEYREVYSAEQNLMYDNFIALADESFSNEEYTISRAWYYKAADVKEKENYPKEKIEEINDLVAQKMNNRQEKEYKKFINLADSALRLNELAVARGWYHRASTTEPAAAYPREQLKEIARRVAEQINAKQQEQFDSHMQKAAEAFAVGNYSLAKFWLLKALELDPDNTIALGRLEEAESFLE